MHTKYTHDDDTYDTHMDIHHGQLVQVYSIFFSFLVNWKVVFSINTISVSVGILLAFLQSICRSCVVLHWFQNEKKKNVSSFHSLTIDFSWSTFMSGDYIEHNRYNLILRHEHMEKKEFVRNPWVLIKMLCFIRVDDKYTFTDKSHVVGKLSDASYRRKNWRPSVQRDSKNRFYSIFAVACTRQF